MMIEYTMVCVCMYYIAAGRYDSLRLQGQYSLPGSTVHRDSPSRIIMYSLLCTNWFAEFFIYMFAINSHNHDFRSKEG